MAYINDDYAAVHMVKTGLGHLLKVFDGVVEDVQLMKHHDTMQITVWAKVCIAGESKAQRSLVTDMMFREGTHVVANFAIYDLLMALIPAEDIKEAVADELISIDVLEHCDKVLHDTASMRRSGLPMPE